MSKKKKNQEPVSNTKEYNNITKFAAFWSVFIAGLLFFVEGIVRVLNYIPNVEINFNFGIFHLISNVLLTLALIIPGWRYSKRLPKVMQLLYWVFIILIIVFNFINLSFI